MAADRATPAFYDREAPARSGDAEKTAEHSSLQRYAALEGVDGSTTGILHVCARRGM